MNDFDPRGDGDLTRLPMLSPLQAYESMVEFLRVEFTLAEGGVTHLGGLLAEMAMGPDGSSADPGAVAQFCDAVISVLIRSGQATD